MKFETHLYVLLLQIVFMISDALTLMCALKLQFVSKLAAHSAVWLSYGYFKLAMQWGSSNLNAKWAIAIIRQRQKHILSRTWFHEWQRWADVSELSL